MRYLFITGVAMITHASKRGSAAKAAMSEVLRTRSPALRAAISKRFKPEGIDMVKEIAADKFEEDVLKSKKPVLVDFWAPWCGPCKMLAPEFEKASKEVKDVEFVKVNVDENQEAAQQFGVMGIPTMILVKDGEEVDRRSGAIQADEIQEFVEDALKKDEE